MGTKLPPKPAEVVQPQVRPVCELHVRRFSDREIAKQLKIDRSVVAKILRNNQATVKECAEELKHERDATNDRYCVLGEEALIACASADCPDWMVRFKAGAELMAQGRGKPTERVEQTVQVTGELDLERAEAAIAVLKAAKK